jgi:hypothetical protein
MVNFKLSKPNFVKWFIIIPIFLLGFHFGIVLINIILNFAFTIPFFIRFTGIITGLWIWISIYLYVKYFNNKL